MLLAHTNNTQIQANVCLCFSMLQFHNVIEGSSWQQMSFVEESLSLSSSLILTLVVASDCARESQASLQ